MSRAYRILWCRIFLAVICTFAVPRIFAQDTAELKKQLDELREQNRLLQNQLQQQQEMINQLSRKFSDFQKTNEQLAIDLQTRQADMTATNAPPEKPGGFSVNNVMSRVKGGPAFPDHKRGLTPMRHFASMKRGFSSMHRSGMTFTFMASWT